MFDHKLTFGAHVRHVVERSEASLAALLRIMPNVGGPSNRRRELLYGVVQSRILYAIPAWASVFETKKHKRILEGLQRRVLLRVVSGYRTVSTSAAQVIAGIPPISLLAAEQRRVFLNRCQTLDSRIKEREATLRRWQSWWTSEESHALWTKTLIRDIVPWIQCTFRRTDYYLTQFLSGHGHFRAYLKRFHLVDTEDCLDCGMTDTPEHAVLNCERWTADRDTLMRGLGKVVDKGSIIETMLESDTNWRLIADFIDKVMRSRELQYRENRR